MNKSDNSEHPSTYFVQDRANEEELLRLDEQDRLFTLCMDGVLAEQPDTARFQRVLDVGCGPGGWLIETAKTYPEISLLAGVDISGRMIDHARVQAEAAGVSGRVQFKTGDALRMLEFPDHFFDLVNQRFAISWLRKWDWSKLVREYQRVCKPGGVIRLTEAAQVESNSPALTRLFDLAARACKQAGYAFFADDARNVVVDELVPAMAWYGLDHIQTKVYILEFHTTEQTRQAYAEDMQRTLRTIRPFLRKWTKFPADYDAIYQQMLKETRQPDFEARQKVITAWAINQ